jgi:hypothetical protein
MERVGMVGSRGLNPRVQRDLNYSPRHLEVERGQGRHFQKQREARRKIEVMDVETEGI